MSKSESSSLSRSTRRVSRHAVRDHIARMVLTRQLEPGEKLVQQKLAKQMGVSQGVVREALFELQGMGLVDTHDNRGGVVNPRSGQFLIESLELREIHEGLAARRCCRRITRTRIDELRDMVHEINRLWMADDGQAGAILDRQFHLTLFEISDNSLQMRLSQNFWFSNKLVRLARRPDMERMLSQHLRILSAIESGDEHAAEESARAHVRTMIQVTEEALKVSPSEMVWLVDPLEEELKASTPPAIDEPPRN